MNRATDTAGGALQPPASSIQRGARDIPGSGSDAANAVSGAGLPSVIVERSPLHTALRFLFQKHSRAFAAQLHLALDGTYLGAREHAEYMLDAAIEDFEHLILTTIDRRISEHTPRNTYYLGGRL